LGIEAHAAFVAHWLPHDRGSSQTVHVSGMEEVQQFVARHRDSRRRLEEVAEMFIDSRSDADLTTLLKAAEKSRSVRKRAEMVAGRVGDGSTRGCEDGGDAVVWEWTCDLQQVNAWCPTVGLFAGNITAIQSLAEGRALQPTLHANCDASSAEGADSEA